MEEIHRSMTWVPGQSISSYTLAQPLTPCWMGEVWLGIEPQTGLFVWMLPVYRSSLPWVSESSWQPYHAQMQRLSTCSPQLLPFRESVTLSSDLTCLIWEIPSNHAPPSPSLQQAREDAMLEKTIPIELAPVLAQSSPPESLTAYLHRQPGHSLSELEAWQIGIAVAEGLQALHATGWIHGHLSTDTILITTTPINTVSPSEPKPTDFPNSSALLSPPQVFLAGAGLFAFFPSIPTIFKAESPALSRLANLLPPEIHTQSVVENHPLVDMYAFGVLFWHMVTGQEVTSSWYASQEFHTLSPETQVLLTHTLSPSPSNRWHRCHRVLSHLQKALAGTEAAPHPTTSNRPPLNPRETLSYFTPPNTHEALSPLPPPNTHDVDEYAQQFQQDWGTFLAGSSPRQVSPSLEATLFDDSFSDQVLHRLDHTNFSVTVSTTQVQPGRYPTLTYGESSPYPSPFPAESKALASRSIPTPTLPDPIPEAWEQEVLREEAKLYSFSRPWLTWGLFLLLLAAFFWLLFR